MPNINTILNEHVTFQCECIDRLFLNGYIPILQLPGQAVNFMIKHRGEKAPSTAIFRKITSNYVAEVERFARERNIPLLPFPKDADKEEFAQTYFERASGEGVVFIGVAQEKAMAFRSYRPKTRVRGEFEFSKCSLNVNHYYFYILDPDFGASFIKVCTYAPFAMRIWLNGHDWVKHQLEKRDIPFEGLDNCILSSPRPDLVQQVCDELDVSTVRKFFERWMAVLPQPLSEADREAGYRHHLSIFQFEMSLTQVFDRPLAGRQFFEEVIRDHLDLGRPDKIQLIFNRRVSKRTPGRFRTRVITSGVDPRLYLDYKHSGIKQYYKQGRALRTETTINDTRDFGIGRDISHLPDLRTIGREANRRLLDAQCLSEHCIIGATTFQQVVLPSVADGQRAPGLRFGDDRVMALLSCLCQFCHLPQGFTNASLRSLVAGYLGQDYTSHQMTYDLRRLRRKGLIARIPRTRRYTPTPAGRRIAFFFAKTYTRIFQPGMAQLEPSPPQSSRTPLATAWHRLDEALTLFVQNANLVPTKT